MHTIAVLCVTMMHRDEAVLSSELSSCQIHYIHFRSKTSEQILQNTPLERESSR